LDCPVGQTPCARWRAPRKHEGYCLSSRRLLLCGIDLKWPITPDVWFQRLAETSWKLFLVGGPSVSPRLVSRAKKERERETRWFLRRRKKERESARAREGRQRERERRDTRAMPPSPERIRAARARSRARPRTRRRARGGARLVQSLPHLCGKLLGHHRAGRPNESPSYLERARSL
jgi:hypothetical protein